MYILDSNNESMDLIKILIFIFLTSFAGYVGLIGALRKRLYWGSMWPGHALNKKGKAAVVWGSIMFLVLSVAAPWTAFERLENKENFSLFVVIIILSLLLAIYVTNLNKRRK